QTSRQAALAQCLQTSEFINQRIWPSPDRAGRSAKVTWRHVFAPSSPVLSYEEPRKLKPSAGTWFHSLQATSQALQPMQMLESVKKPTAWPGRGWATRVLG